MNTQTIADTQPQFPIQELEQIECAIQVSQQWLETLARRREMLTAELERVTCPEAASVKPATKVVGPGLEYRGSIFTHWSYIDIHIDLLRRLWADFPDRRELMASAMASRGTSRRYAAKTLGELFPGHTSAWAQRYSRVLVDGWYVDTNLNRERMRRILPAAVAAAGLQWGKDVKAYWRPTRIAE